MGIGHATVERAWKMPRALLRRKIEYDIFDGLRDFVSDPRVNS